MKNKLSTIGLIGVFIVGLLIFMYPTIADVYNKINGSYVINSYETKIQKLDDTELKEALDKARLYNTNLLDKQFVLVNGEPKEEAYTETLNLTNNNVMGYIEIDKIDVKLPIYHGTSEPVLQKAIGHIEGSALPVGGNSTHSILSGHRGLPSAKLFTNLDKVEVSDKIVLKVAGETLTYEVFDITVVEPDSVDTLKVQEDKDLLTLVTCTPYGVNSHRLLVTGERCENLAEEEVIITNNKTIDYEKVIFISILVIATIIIIIITKKKEQKRLRRRKRREGRRSGREV